MRGVRPFIIEQRLIKLVPGIKPELIRLKQNRLKTEPAFADVWSIEGDPYQAILELEVKVDKESTHLLYACLPAFTGQLSPM